MNVAQSISLEIPEMVVNANVSSFLTRSGLIHTCKYSHIEAFVLSLELPFIGPVSHAIAFTDLFLHALTCNGLFCSRLHPNPASDAVHVCSNDFSCYRQLVGPWDFLYGISVQRSLFSELM